MSNSVCPSCIEVIREGAKFCTYCGEKLIEETPPGPYFTILTKEQSSIIFPLVEGRSTIGRNINNSIILSDELVSTYHAAVLFRNGSCWIEDLNSRNGVYINGKKISRRLKLENDSLIKIGSTILKYSAEHEEVET